MQTDDVMKSTARRRGARGDGQQSECPYSVMGRTIRNEANAHVDACAWGTKLRDLLLTA